MKGGDGGETSTSYFEYTTCWILSQERRGDSVMAQRLAGYISKQLPIPGLESKFILRRKEKTDAQDQLRDLQDRVLKLELEVSLLRILMEKGG